MCTDMLLSSGLGGAEVMLKQRLLPNSFYLLPAGDEAEIYLFLNELRKVIPLGTSKPHDDEMLQMVRKAIGNRKYAKAEDYVMQSYGLSYEEFLASGRSRFPDDIYKQVLMDIRGIDLGMEGIITGFNAYDYALIIEFDSRGQTSIREDWATVGSGSLLASASLSHRQQVDVRDPRQSLYIVYEAKKYAERVGSVGKQTTLNILAPSGEVRRITPEIKEALDGLFKKLGPQPIPVEIEELKKERDLWETAGTRIGTEQVNTEAQNLDRDSTETTESSDYSIK